ncbi:MAG: HAD family hydrolase, partial [Thiohalorhabdaceae bacterium]
MNLAPLSPEAIEDRLSRIRLLILDGIKLLQRYGLGVAIITGRRSAGVEHRAQELGIEPIVQGAQKKGEALDQILTSSGVDADRAAMVGDDVVDLPAMVRTG